MQRHQTTAENEALRALAEPEQVQQNLSRIPASNDARGEDERIRALDMLARCMLDAGLGG